MGGSDSKDEPTCKDCRFFGSNSELGQCRRYPPTVHGGEARFPIVRETAWCGEFQTRVLADPIDDRAAGELRRSGGDVDAAFASLTTVWKSGGDLADLDAAAARAALDIIPDIASEAQNVTLQLGRKLLTPLLAMHFSDRRRHGEKADRASFLASIEPAINDRPTARMEADSFEHEQIKIWAGQATSEAQRAALHGFLRYPRAMLSEALTIVAMHVGNGK